VDSDEPLVLPPIYLFGVWLSIVLAIGSPVFSVPGHENPQAVGRTAATELVLTREQHLTQLDGLAAAAGARTRHGRFDDFSDLARTGESLQITASSRRYQDLARTGAALPRHPGKITQLSATGAPFDRMKLSTLIEEILAPHRDFGVAIKVRRSAAPASRRQPASAILYGVAYLENAVGFRADHGEVNAWWNSDTVEIVISDDGPGFAPDIIKRIGEPYLSRRRSPDDGQTAIAASGSGYLSPHAAGAHRRQRLLHQPGLSGSRRRGPMIAWQATLRGRRKYQPNRTLRCRPALSRDPYRVIS